MGSSRRPRAPQRPASASGGWACLPRPRVCWCWWRPRAGGIKAFNRGGPGFKSIHLITKWDMGIELSVVRPSNRASKCPSRPSEATQVAARGRCPALLVRPGARTAAPLLRNPNGRWPTRSENRSIQAFVFSRPPPSSSSSPLPTPPAAWPAPHPPIHHTGAIGLVLVDRLCVDSIRSAKRAGDPTQDLS